MAKMGKASTDEDRAAVNGVKESLAKIIDHARGKGKGLLTGEDWDLVSDLDRVLSEKVK